MYFCLEGSGKSLKNKKESCERENTYLQFQRKKLLKWIKSFAELWVKFISVVWRLISKSASDDNNLLNMEYVLKTK